MKRPSSLPRCSRLMSLNRNMASFFLFKACDPNACPAPYLLQGIAMRGTHRIMLPATTKSSCIYVLCQYSRRHFFERRDILDCKCLVLSQTLMHTRVTKQPRGGGGRREKSQGHGGVISNLQSSGPRGSRRAARLFPPAAVDNLLLLLLLAGHDGRLGAVVTQRQLRPARQALGMVWELAKDAQAD